MGLLSLSLRGPRQCANALPQRVWRGLVLLVLLTAMLRPLQVAGKLEGRRCRAALAEQGLTLIEQLHQTNCVPCNVPPETATNLATKSSSAVVVDSSLLLQNNTENSNTTALSPATVCNNNESKPAGGSTSNVPANNNVCANPQSASSKGSKSSKQKERYHVVVLLMGISKMEKALVLMAELLDRDHYVTVITTQQMSITNHIVQILRQHIPCHKNIMDHLHVEALNMNEAWPCQPPLQQTLHITSTSANTAHHGYYHNGRTNGNGATEQSNRKHQPQTNNPHDSSMPLHCNALNASVLMRKLLRIVTRMNRRPDVIVADSTLLAGILVAEASKLPCLAIVSDDVTTSHTLKWTHPHIYRQHIRDSGRIPKDSENFAVSARQTLENWWLQWQDQIGMTRAFMNYNYVRRKLHLPPRFQILDFWKTVVLWTSVTQHLTNPPNQSNPRNFDTTEQDFTFVDFKAYLYSKTGIGIGTSASKGNSLPLISLPEAAVPPCQPCEIDEEEWTALKEIESDQNNTIANTPQLPTTTNNSREQSGPMEILLPYYSYANTLEDRRRFRKLMRALVLLRDSLLAWRTCKKGNQSSFRASSSLPCWSSDRDFKVIRLGGSHEAFVPSIVQFDSSPFLDAIATHKNLVAVILPNCGSSSSSQWMQDLGLPSVCVPQGHDWDARSLALRIGRLLRRVERTRQSGNGVLVVNAVSRNKHTTYGTSIGNVVNVIETMAETKRDSQAEWGSGDDLSWDIWLRLGLVHRPTTLQNTDTWGGWLKGTLMVLSWFVLVSAVLYLILKDQSWFSGYFTSTSKRRRNKDINQHDGDSASSSLSLLRFLYCPYFLLRGFEFLKEMWAVILDEFSERLPDLDRLFDMWKEWCAEESEQMNLLLFSWLDKLEEAPPTPIPSSKRHSEQQNGSSNHNHHHNNHNSNNHVPPSRKRRATRKKH